MQTRVTALTVGLCILFAGVAPESVAQQTTSGGGAERVVRGTCVTCHNDRTLRGNLSLERFDVAAAADHPEVAEAMIRKLRAGMMPPPTPRRPDDADLRALADTLEAQLDEASGIAPDPGGRPFQRLNRAEYARAVRDLLGLEVDAGDWLPLDQMSANFDNIADAQTLSPTLLEAYLNAASAIAGSQWASPAGGPSTTPTPTPNTCRSIPGTTSRARPTAPGAASSSTTCSRPTRSTSSG